MTGIIWLASYPKSGNTWMRAFLANYLQGGDEPLDINDLPKGFLGDNFLIHYKQRFGRPEEDFLEMDFQELAPYRREIHLWMARSFGRDVFVKTHNALVLAEGNPMITPEATAGAIYVIRNPMDVAVSFAHHYQIELDAAVEALCNRDYWLPPGQAIGDATPQLAQCLLDWSGHYRSWMEAPGLTRHVVRYEDMVLKPVKAFGAVTKFLTLPRDDKRLKRAIKFSSFRELAKQEKTSGFVEARPDNKTRFFRSGKVGGYREALNDEQVQTLVDAHREVMTELGYLSKGGEITV